MASRHQICRVARSEFENHHQRLRHVGGINPDGSSWKITELDAIAGIEAGRWRFFIAYQGREWDVVVTLSKYGRKYLRTTADRLQPDSLLSLPECP